MESDNSKENILQTALALFASKGYDAVGVQEICEKAGVTKPTLYYFFKSKQGLLESIISARGEELLQSVKASASYEQDFINSLTKILTCHILFAKKNPEFYKFHVSLLNAPEESEAKSVCAPFHKKLSSCLETFFVRSAAQFGNMRGKEKLYALLFSNTVQTLAIQAVNKKVKITDQLVFQIVHSFVYGVAN